MFPFDVDGLPGGAVQVDLVFNEHLPEPPVTVAIPPLGEFLADVQHMEVDWHNFRDEYPDVTDEAAPWLQRLAHALRN